MRHSHNAPGSTAAQSTLQAIAGWAPSRRSFLGSMLVASSATAAVASGAAIAIPAAAADAPTVSPRMAELVAIYKRETARVDSLEATTEDDFLNAQAALLNEEPRTMADYAAKFDALMEIETADGEFASLQRLSDDAHALARAAE